MPSEVAKRAPGYYKLFTNWRYARPQWDLAMRDVFQEIKNQDTESTRFDERADSRRRADDRFVAQRDAMRFLTPKESLDFLLAKVWNSSTKYNSLVAGLKKRGEYDLANQLDGAMRDFQYQQNDVMLYATGFRERVMLPIQEAGIAREDFLTYLENQLYRQGRAEMYNPVGITSKAAGTSNEELQTRLGPDKFKRMEEVAADWFQLRMETSLKMLEEENALRPETMELLKSRDAYQTIRAIRQDENMADWLLCASSPSSGFAVRQAHGTMQDAMSVDMATVKTDESAIKFVLRNRFARSMHQLCQEMNIPHTIVEQRWDADAQRKVPVRIENNKHYSTITYWDQGDLIGVNVPADLGNMLNNEMSGGGWENVAMNVMSTFTRGMKSMFTKYAPGFALGTNKAIDYGSYKLLMPGVNPSFNKHRIKANEAALSIAQGSPNDLAKQALDLGIIMMREGRVTRGADPLTEFLQRNSLPMENDGSPVAEALRKIHASYSDAAAMYEMRTKIIGMMELMEKHPNMTKEVMQHIVQERSGSNNYLQGPASPWPGLIIPFWSPTARGWSAVYDAMHNQFKGDKSRRAFLIKSIAVLIATELLPLLLENFGPDDLKKKYKAVGRHDKNNYFVVPLWWEDEANHKVMRLRFPVPHILRPAKSLIRNIFNAAAKSDVTELMRIGDTISYGADQLPGLNPFIFTVLPALIAMLRGAVPNVRGRPLFDEDLSKASQWTEFIKWGGSQIGGSAVWRYRNNSLTRSGPDAA